MTERTTVIGRLGREPVKKSTARGEVTVFSLAQSSRVLGPDGEWGDGPTTWYEVSAWDRLAANAAVSLHKGQPVLVHGVVFTHEWTGRDGETRTELRIRAAAIGHDLSSGTASFAKASPASAAPAAPLVDQPAQQQPTSEPRPAREPGDWGAMPVSPPAPAAATAGWSTAYEAEGEAPF